ncbi:hypothetical protein GCM10027056_20250 [Glaciibacter psychrotolerans]
MPHAANVARPAAVTPGSQRTVRGRRRVSCPADTVAEDTVAEDTVAEDTVAEDTVAGGS